MMINSNNGTLRIVREKIRECLNICLDFIKIIVYCTGRLDFMPMLVHDLEKSLRKYTTLHIQKLYFRVSIKL